MAALELGQRSTSSHEFQLRGSPYHEARFRPLSTSPSLPANPLRCFLRAYPWVFPLGYSIIILMQMLIYAILRVFAGFSHEHLEITPSNYHYGAFYYSLSSLGAIFLIATGYVRWRLQEYYLDCAKEKLLDDANGLTGLNAQAKLVKLHTKINDLRGTNTLASYCCYATAAAFLIFGSFQFYNEIVYLIGFFIFMLTSFSFFILTNKMTDFLAKTFKYESRPLSMIVTTWISFVIYILYFAFLIIFVSLLPHATLYSILKDSSLLTECNITLTVLEWLSKAAFPIYSLFLFRRMYLFPRWQNVNFF